MRAKDAVLKLRVDEIVPSRAGTFLAVVLFAVQSLATVHGDEPPRELPKDGAFVRYRIEGVHSLRGIERARSATKTLSLVGTVVEEGVNCRWIEEKTVTHEPANMAGTLILKRLIPEKDILSSKRPSEQVRRAWVRLRDTEVMKVEVSRLKNVSEEVLLWTPGMLKDSDLANNETKDINFQQGQFKNAQGWKGEFVDKHRLRNTNKEFKLVRKHTVWQHPELLFGFAEATIHSEQFIEGEKIEWESSVYRLQDVGTNAKTELPDNN